MIQPPYKPRITIEPRRDDYSVAVTIRWRRPWAKMTSDQRTAVLIAGALWLEELAAQMRREAAGE